MGDAAIAALVGAMAGLVVTLGKIAWDVRQANREKRLAARERLDKYRAPFLAAVDDLGRRVNNIRKDEFLAYLNVEARREMAKLSTLFRLATYLGWTEIVYGYADRLRFESDAETRMVKATLGDIGWILAIDEFDRKDEWDFTTSRLLLWREEQRAIGELMLLEGGEVGCIGFDSFATNYDMRFSRWFGTFASELTSSAANTDRLAELHKALVRLLEQLDVDRVLIEVDDEGRILRPRWARPASLARPSDAPPEGP
jgi:hypothetical protein